MSDKAVIHIRLGQSLLLVSRFLELSLFAEFSGFKGLGGLEENSLSHVSLLVLQHLFARVADKPQLMHIDLYLVLERL